MSIEIIFVLTCSLKCVLRVKVEMKILKTVVVMICWMKVVENDAGYGKLVKTGMEFA